MTDYAAVWREPQNIGAARSLQGRLSGGTAVDVVLQPGDGTRYAFRLTPLPGPRRGLVISDDGRPPADLPASHDRLLVEVLNPGFASRPCVALPPWGNPPTAERLASELGIRNICTAMALAATVAALTEPEENPDA